MNMAVDLSWWFQQRCSSLFVHQAINSLFQHAWTSLSTTLFKLANSTLFKLASSTMFKLASSPMFKPVNRKIQAVRFYVCNRPPSSRFNGACTLLICQAFWQHLNITIITIITRNVCDQEYIGQTKRQFGTRLKVHQKAVFFSKKETSTLSERACVTNNEIAWQNSKIITINPRIAQRTLFIIMVAKFWIILSNIYVDVLN